MNVQDERIKSWLLIWVFSALAVLTARPATVFAQTITGTISRIGDTTHLEFRGRQQWIYKSPTRKGDTVSVTLPAFDDTTVAHLKAWKCPFIKKISINKNGPDGKYRISFQLTNPDVDVFDYLTDDPSSLIFDFYKTTPKPPVAQTKTPVKKPSKTKFRKKRSRKIASVTRHRHGRAPASTEFMKMNGSQSASPNQVVVADLSKESGQSGDQTAANIRFEQGVFDGEDPNYNRFRIKDYQIKEDAIIASQQNIYIQFPMLPLRLNRFDEMVKQSPIYEIKPDDDLMIAEQNKDARFLLYLFKEQHWGAFFKSYSYFEKKYPNSKYDEIVKNMAAEAYIHLYQRDGDDFDRQQFRSLYTYLIDKYPDSVLAERNLLLLGYSHLQADDGAEALRLMMLHQQKYPNSPEGDKVKMAIAESQLLMAEPDKALDTYKDLIKNPRDKASAVEAMYRIGDVYFHEKDYQKAIDAYEEAQKKYPSFNIVYPNAQYNESEAKFWLHQYKASLDGFIKFVSIYPNHDYGGYALTRIGELLEILGADPQKVTGAFTEAYFRYPNCPGSEVARVRMLSQALKGMSDREKKLAIAEINQIVAKSKLPGMDEFATLMKASGLSQRGEYQDSLDLLLGYFQSHPGTAKLDVFRGRILRNISDVMKDQLKNHQYMDALNFFDKYQNTWLKNSGRVDTAFYEAEAFEQAGVPKEAERSYKQILAKLQSIAGTKEEKERRVYENLPTISEVNLRLAAVSVQQRQYQEAYQYLKNIKSDLKPAQEIERVQIGATVAEQTGDINDAVQNLEKLEKAYAKDPKQAPLMVKPELQLARLYLQQKKFANADASLKQVEDQKNSGNGVSDNEWAQALTLRGNLLLAEGQKLAAVQAYSKLLDSFEASRPLASIRYKAGKILFDDGDLNGAQKMWTGFEGDTADFYQQLAQEKLHEARWEDTYKKYIERIPAAETLK